MPVLRLILMILAIVCFFLAAVGTTVPCNGSLLGAGLGLWALAVLIAP
jgi:hypothetical protein